MIFRYQWWENLIFSTFILELWEKKWLLLKICEFFGKTTQEKFGFLAFGYIPVAVRIFETLNIFGGWKSAELMLFGVEIERYDWFVSGGFGLVWIKKWAKLGTCCGRGTCWAIFANSSEKNSSSKLWMKTRNVIEFEKWGTCCVGEFAAVGELTAVGRLAHLTSPRKRVPLSSTHQFHTEGPLLFSPKNPSVSHQKPLSSTRPAQFHTKNPSVQHNPLSSTAKNPQFHPPSGLG